MTLIITLIAFAFLFFFLEIFVPGGLLAVLGGILIIIASVQAYPLFGFIPAALIFVGAGFGAILMFFAEVNLLTKTPLGKHIRHTDQINGGSLKEVPVESLKGTLAEVVTPLNPSGRIRVEGKTYDAKSESGWVGKGVKVQIVGSDVFNVLVRAVEDE